MHLLLYNLLMYVSQSVSQRQFQQSHQINQIQQFQFLSQVDQNSEIMNQNSEIRRKKGNQTTKSEYKRQTSEFWPFRIPEKFHPKFDMNKDIFDCVKNIDKDLVYQTP